jgi:hypothetical protein
MGDQSGQGRVDKEGVTGQRSIEEGEKTAASKQARKPFRFRLACRVALGPLLWRERKEQIRKSVYKGAREEIELSTLAFAPSMRFD